MKNFRINNPDDPEPETKTERQEYEPGTSFTFRGIFTFITEPAQTLSVNIA